MTKVILWSFVLLCLFGLYLVPQAMASAQQTDPGGGEERFATELRSDPLVRSLSNLRLTSNQISSKSNTLVGSYLKTTGWYETEIKRLGLDQARLNYFEAALRHLDQHSNLIPNQKIQCIGFAILLHSLSDLYPSIGGAEIYYAKDLVPDTIKNGNDKKVDLGDYSALVITKIEEVNVGDFILRYDSNVGHVSGVIGKKIIAGQTILLIATANQDRDGRITIFEVDQGNFEYIFGSAPFKKVILRNN